jgi:predicted transcriptional regulator
MSRTKFAALTAGLLARKGEAAPSAHSAFTLAAAYRDTVDQPERPHEKTATPHDLSALIERARPQGLPVVVRREALAEIAPAPMPAPIAVEPVPAPLRLPKRVFGLRGAVAPAPPFPHRTAVTVRLDDARYVRLKLAGARFHRTSQDILTRAIDAYLTALGTEPVGPDELARWRARGQGPLGD